MIFRWLRLRKKCSACAGRGWTYGQMLRTKEGVTMHFDRCDDCWGTGLEEIRLIEERTRPKP